VVRNALGQLAAIWIFRAGMPRRVVLAVDEALTNIIRHAYLRRRRARGLSSAGFLCRTMVRAGIALEIVPEDRGPLTVNP